MTHGRFLAWSLAIGFVTSATLICVSCYDATKPSPCDPTCGDLPVPGVPYHRFKWQREKLRDSGIPVREPFGKRD